MKQFEKPIYIKIHHKNLNFRRLHEAFSYFRLTGIYNRRYLGQTIFKRIKRKDKYSISNSTSDSNLIEVFRIPYFEYHDNLIITKQEYIHELKKVKRYFYKIGRMTPELKNYIKKIIYEVD